MAANSWEKRKRRNTENYEIGARLPRAGTKVTEKNEALYCSGKRDEYDAQRRRRVTA